MRGDPRAFAQLYVELAPQLRRFCVALIGRSDGEDLMQEVFVKMHHARTSFAPDGSAVRWSFAIARTSWIDRMRRSRRRPELALPQEALEALGAADTSCPEAGFRRAALAGVLETELHELSEPLRLAFVLVKLEGLSCGEAGKRLGTSQSATKQRVHRAAEGLRNALREAGWSAP